MKRLLILFLGLTTTVLAQDPNGVVSLGYHEAKRNDDTTRMKVLIGEKQASLVSGTNIKTINGSSVLGSGDLTVSGSAAWGSVTGTLSSQTDLATALGAKSDSTDRETRTHTAATYLTPSGSAANLTSFPTLNQSTTGSAATITTARNIGGRSFNGSADIVAPVWKCGQGTRDISTASGAQNIAHGLGRVPSYVHIRLQLVFSAAVSMECNAVYDGASQSGQCIIWTEGTTTATTDNIYQSTAAAVGLSNAGGTNPFTGATKASGVITVDATNIIITWTKSGSPTGTANVAWEVQ